MKANHNQLEKATLVDEAVSSYAKLLKWKQITTRVFVAFYIFRL